MHASPLGHDRSGGRWNLHGSVLYGLVVVVDEGLSCDWPLLIGRGGSSEREEKSRTMWEGDDGCWLVSSCLLRRDHVAGQNEPRERSKTWAGDGQGTEVSTRTVAGDKVLARHGWRCAQTERDVERCQQSRALELCSTEFTRTVLTPVARSHPTGPSNGVLPNDPHVKLTPLISPLAIAVPIVRPPKLGVAQGRRGPLGPARRDTLGRVDGRDRVVVGRIERVEVERARRRRRGRSWQGRRANHLGVSLWLPIVNRDGKRAYWGGRRCTGCRTSSSLVLRCPCTVGLSSRR